jgi:hypothetical protein
MVGMYNVVHSAQGAVKFSMTHSIKVIGTRLLYFK